MNWLLNNGLSGHFRAFSGIFLKVIEFPLTFVLVPSILHHSIFYLFQAAVESHKVFLTLCCPVLDVLPWRPGIQLS